jgi:tRNA threonylcarbamoyl adenosine modification protein (Sua5/YciO/YrdC/YwlC family)
LAYKGKKTVGIRVPDHPIPQLIVEKLGHPIASTSIKDDDEVIEYSTDPELIAEKYDHLVDIVIDSGYGDNVASTIVDLTSGEPEILREGKEFCKVSLNIIEDFGANFLVPFPLFIHYISQKEFHSTRGASSVY